MKSIHWTHDAYHRTNGGMVTLVLLGLGAGALTTMAGLGGGQLLVLVLAATGGAHSALVLSAPALLVGNLHRAWQFRGGAAGPLAGSFAVGALPGSLLGGRLAAGLPVVIVHVLLVATTALSIARALGWWKMTLRPVSMAPAGFGIGLLSAGSGTGLLVAPLLLAHGLSGPGYLVTSSLCAASLHVGRVGGYALGGLVDGSSLARSALLAVAIVAGNLAGERLRRLISPRAGRVLEQGVLVACVLCALAVAG
jgi:uncharacterized protein